MYINGQQIPIETMTNIVGAVIILIVCVVFLTILGRIKK
jgi:hypothetical protein